MTSVISNQLVVIVGAGASKELKLPTGDELKKIIATKLQFTIDSVGKVHGGDHELLLALTTRERSDLNFKNWFDCADLTSRVMPLAPSIDNFLDAHSGNRVIEFCGKIAIAKSKIESEKSSSIYINMNENPNNQMNYTKCENTWLNAFFKMLCANCTIANLPARLKTIVFIVFNYDRCIEHFLYHAIIDFYNISPQECSAILSNLIIYHPYGSVGTLPWRNLENPIDFGKNLTTHELISMTDNIKTFTEGTNKSGSEIEGMRNILKSANKIIFLGFAYHEINMELLCPQLPLKDTKHQPKIYGTAFGQSPSDTDDITHTLSALLNSPKDSVLIRNDKKCSELFYEFSRAFSFGSLRRHKRAW